jgi:hypothetical protein
LKSVGAIQHLEVAILHRSCKTSFKESWENAEYAKGKITYSINHYWDMRAGRLQKA